MELDFNVTGARRKELVNEIENIDGSRREYLGVPSCAYRVGDFHISKDGVVTAEETKLMGILARLMVAGFEPVNLATVTAQEAHSPEEKEVSMDEPGGEKEAAQGEAVGLTIELPIDGFDEIAFWNLNNLIKAKNRLIKKALGIEALPIEKGVHSIKFPWFSNMLAPDEVEAYTDLIRKMAEQAKKQKRVNAKEKEVENEKYAFRCFLLRLGFIGSEYKQQRKILLKRLEGSSAFKAGRPAAAEE